MLIWWSLGKISIIERGFIKMGFYLFWCSKHLFCISRVVCCSLGPVFVIRYVISFIFSKFHGTFWVQKRGLGTFRLG